MARSFNGTSDRIDSGNNAFTGMNLTTATLMVHANQLADIASGTQFYVATITQANGSNVRSIVAVPPAAGTGYRLQSRMHATAANGNRSGTDLTTGAWQTALASINRSALANLPDLYRNGSLDNAASSSASGTLITGDDTVRLGANAAASNFCNAELGFVAIASGGLGASEANRHRWWGMAPGGPSTMLLCLPLWTDNLANKGTAGAVTFTATGTSMVASPVVERCWASTMGCGR